MNEFLVGILFLLLPGIVSAVICDRIVIHAAPWGQFKFSLYSILLGFGCYFLLQIFYFILFLDVEFTGQRVSVSYNHPDNILRTWQILAGNSGELPYFEMMFSLLLSFPVALICSAIINYKVINKIAQKLHVTTKYGDENLFSFYMNNEEVSWVYVRDIRNQFTYQGKVHAYSETSTIQELVLYDVTVYSYEESIELYSLPKIYLANPNRDFIVEIIPDENLG